MNFDNVSREFYYKIEKEIDEFLATGKRGSELRKYFSRYTKDMIKELKIEVWQKLRSMSELERKELNAIAEPILKGFTHMAERLEKDVIFEMKINDTREKKAARIKQKIGVQNHIARTITKTGSDAITQAKRINDALEAGIEYFKYIGPAPERKFCREHYNKVYSKAEIEQMDNGQGLPVLYYAGGYNCHHQWVGVIKDEDAAEIQTDKIDFELTENQLKAKKYIEEEYGVEMPANFYKDDLEKEIKFKKRVQQSEGRSFFNPNDNSINITIVENKTTEFILKKTIAHECAHGRHHFQDLINGNYTRKDIKAVFNKHRKEVLDLINPRTIGAPQNFHEELKLWRAFDAKLKDDKIIDTLKKEGYAEYEIEKLQLATADFFGALTRNKVGWGHSDRYYENLNWQAMEWFAHCSENYYVGNRYFELAFPGIYKETIEFMKGLAK